MNAGDICGRAMLPSFTSALLFAAAAYALGFFQGSSSVAFGADHILDLIPGDTVASLVVTAGAAAAAATAAGSTCVPGQQNGSTTIYHAASSGSYPLSVVPAFSYMHSYFKDNPAPLRLPFTRCGVCWYEQPSHGAQHA